MAIDQSSMKFALTSPQLSPRVLYFGVTTGVAQVQTITMDTFANSGQADFIVLVNKAGQKEALWLDKDAAGVQPTATAFLNCEIKTVVPIATGDDEIAVAAALVAAVTIPGVTVLDNTDGTITFTQQIFGSVTAIVASNADGSGAGSISVAAPSTAGVDVVVGNGKFDATVSQTGVGTFVITFREPFARAPEVCGNSKTDNLICRITGSTTLAVTIEMNNVTSGNAANGSFSCIVAGSNSADLTYQ